MTDDDLTQEDVEALRNLGYGYPQPEEKHNPISFLKFILKRHKNIKSGNLNDEELGHVHLPVRTNLDLSHYCNAMGMGNFGKFFEGDAQTILGSSLSKGGFLNILAVTQRRESTASLKKAFNQTKKRGWFPKKEEGG